MELKILYMVADTRKFYTCTGCQTTIEVLGNVLKMYTCPSNSFGFERDWIQVSLESLRNSR
jgi:hypothetical protein